MKLNMSARPFSRPAPFKNRVIMLLIGELLQGFGLSFILKCDLGVDPWSCFVLGVSNQIHLSYGTSQLICSAALFVFVIIFDIGKISYGTVANMVMVGYIADFFKWIWEAVLPFDLFATPLSRYIIILPAIAILVSGVSAYMSADLGGAPYDALPVIISERIKKLPFRVIRMIWDLTFIAVGFLLGGQLGLVTLILGFCLGPVISWYRGILSRFVTPKETE